VARAFGLDENTCCAELDAVKLLALEGPEPTYTPLPRFPAILRDIAVVCDAETPVGALTECITGAGSDVLRDVKLFDVYAGPGVPAGRKSVAFSLTLRSEDSTLTDEHAEEAVAKILAALKEKLNAVIR
jgi:phenylalanyl-tRNA synthetase beta chain